MDPTRFWLAVLWACVALASLRNASQRRAGRWKSCAALAALMVSIALSRWNVQLWRTAQAQLRNWGLYQDRVYIKVAVAVVILLLTLALARRFGRRFWRELRGGHLTLFATGGAAFYVMLLTLSLDNFMPSFFAGGSGRYITEYSLGGLALVGALFSIRSIGR